ncbi:MAG: hypothetical protein ACPG5P_07980, partial [Saprospiraceae bacterium]
KLKSTVIPVVAFCLEGDDLAPEKAVKNLIHKYPNHTERKYFFISKKEYGKPDLGHFNWAKEPDYLIAKIEDLF